MAASLEPLYDPLRALQQLIDHFDGQGVIVGGVAASILGKPRLTADAGALMLVSLDDLPRLVELAQEVGLEPRFADAQPFARANRVLLLRHVDSGINVDISLGLLPFEVEAVERGQEHVIGSLRIRLPTPEDLVILKAVAHRPRDLLDIEALIASTPDFDRHRVAFWVKQFAELLESPELWSDVAACCQAPELSRAPT